MKSVEIAAAFCSLRDGAPSSMPVMQAQSLHDFVFVLDLLVMCILHRLLKAFAVASFFGIVRTVSAVMQIALGIQASLVGPPVVGFIQPNAS